MDVAQSEAERLLNEATDLLPEATPEDQKTAAIFAVNVALGVLARPYNELIQSKRDFYIKVKKALQKL